MRLSSESFYPVIVLTVLAGATLWLERTTREETPGTARQSIDTPDFTAESARLVSFDETGAQRYELLATRISHFPRKELSLLDHPRLSLDDGGQSTLITATSGEIRSRGEEVFLQGSVEVTRTDSNANDPLRLSAETLTVWPNDQRASSDDPVTITQTGSVARGNSLRADNIFGTLELLGNASMQMPGRSGKP